VDQADGQVGPALEAVEGLAQRRFGVADLQPTVAPVVDYALHPWRVKAHHGHAQPPHSTTN